MKSFLPQNLSSIHQGVKRTLWLCVWTKPERPKGKAREGRPEKELERQTRVCGNSLLCGPVPRSDPNIGQPQLVYQGSILPYKSGPGVRKNCPPRVDTIWKEWVFGKSPRAHWMPTSLHLLRPPPTGSTPFSCSDSYKNPTAFHQQPVVVSPHCCRRRRCERPGDTMKSLLLLSILAALAVAALCYGENLLLLSLCFGFFSFLPLTSVFMDIFLSLLLFFPFCSYNLTGPWIWHFQVLWALICSIKSFFFSSHCIFYLFNIQTLVCNLIHMFFLW